MLVNVLCLLVKYMHYRTGVRVVFHVTCTRSRAKSLETHRCEHWVAMVPNFLGYLKSGAILTCTHTEAKYPQIHRERARECGRSYVELFLSLPCHVSCALQTAPQDDTCAMYFSALVGWDNLGCGAEGCGGCCGRPFSFRLAWLFGCHGNCVCPVFLCV